MTGRAAVALRRFRSAEGELVAALNGYLALAFGAANFIRFDLPLGFAIASAIVAFLFLSACLLHPYTAVFAATVGTILSGLFTSFWGVALGGR